MSRFTPGFPLAGLVVLGLALSGCAGDLRVGAVISESGAADVYGKKVRKGLDLALEEINAAGGVDGRPLTVVYRDDASKPEIGTQMITELVEQEGVDVVIGAVLSSVTLEIAPYCEKERVVLLSPTASAPQITDAGEYIFRNYPSDILEGTSMADFARDLGLRTIVIFAVDDAFGAGLRDVFTQKYENRFREVVRVFDYQDGDTSGFDAAVGETRGLRPDGIYVIGYVQGVATLLQRIHDAGLDSVVMGSGSVIEDVVRLAGPAAEHLVYPQPPFDAESEEPAVRSFVEGYRGRYGEAPDLWAAHGYDALKLVATAIERSGSASADSVRVGLKGIESYEGASGPAGFDGNGDVVQYPRLFIIHDGRPKPYERFLEQGGSLDLPDRG